jgi:heptosyltransferase-2
LENCAYYTSCALFKQQLKNAEAHYLTKKLTAPLLRIILMLIKFTCCRRLEANDPGSENENFDYIIDLHHNLRTLRIKLALRNITSFSFNKLNYEKWLLTALKINSAS